ncbi:hypothetical protein BH24ACI3_BH24ACI3_10560 [soil metagenome]
MNDRELILAIESGVSGGSISFLSQGVEIGNICGESSTSRAEDLLPNISKLLDDCGRELSAITMIAVSNGPGSFTGIRIGAATALGLARSLGIEQKSVSVLHAMAISTSGKVMVAVPTGRDDLAYAIFDVLGSTLHQLEQPKVIERNGIESSIRAADVDSVLLHHDIFESIDSVTDYFEATIVDSGRNLAFLIGRAVSLGHGNDELVPQYLHNPARQRQVVM